ncbi:MAG: CarD family transcriptional regulator [bacterium]|nr:MAG: CarD family transcriptional regulator [bacterium]
MENKDIKKGAMVFYPAYGVGVVENIGKVEKTESAAPFYTIRIQESGMVIRVPAMNAKRIGIRPVIKRNEVPKVLRTLKDKVKVQNAPNWHKRQKNYIDRVKSGSALELAQILRELTQIQSNKELSFGEQRMYDNVRQLLITEIAEAKGIKKDTAGKLVDKAFDS